MVQTKIDRLFREVTGLLILSKLPIYDEPREELSLRLYKGSTKLALDTVTSRKVVGTQERFALMERAKKALQEEGFVVTDATPDGIRCWIQVEVGTD